MKQMSTPNICCIGHITLDRIITPHIETYMPGGTAYYFANALASLEHTDFRLITSVGEPEMGVVEQLRGRGIDVEVIPSRCSVFFENKYGSDLNERTQRVLAKADPFTVESLAKAQARIFHLGTLLDDDFSLDVIKALSTRGTLSVDAQGYLRDVRGEHVYQVDWPQKREAMAYIDILKANEIEMKTLTGSDDPREAARILADWGCKEVLLTLGDRGSLILVDGNYYDIPAYEVDNVVDATGCGDTYMAGYLYRRSHGYTCEEAAHFAAAMCTLKLRNAGPFNATEQQVEAIIGGGDRHSGHQQ